MGKANAHVNYPWCIIGDTRAVDCVFMRREQCAVDGRNRGFGGQCIKIHSTIPHYLPSSRRGSHRRAQARLPGKKASGGASRTAADRAKLSRSFDQHAPNLLTETPRVWARAREIAWAPVVRRNQPRAVRQFLPRSASQRSSSSFIAWFLRVIAALRHGLGQAMMGSGFGSHGLRHRICDHELLAVFACSRLTRSSSLLSSSDRDRSSKIKEYRHDSDETTAAFAGSRQIGSALQQGRSAF
jgi:hypothetical protein